MSTTSSFFADTLVGKSKQPTVYQGSWFLNANYSPGTGDRTYAPGQWTLDSSFMNTNATLLLSSNTSFFAAVAPVQGIYSISNHIRVSGNVTSPMDVYSYLAFHVYNGTSYTALGSPVGLAQRPSFFQSTFGTTTTNIVHTPSIVQELKAGDTVAPWFGCNQTNYSVQGAASLASASTRFTVTLLKQTA